MNPTDTNINTEPINIVTPSATPTYTYAGFWWRFLAVLIDGFIIQIIMFIPWLLFIFTTSLRFNKYDSYSYENINNILPSILAIIGFSFFAFIVNLLYNTLFESSKYQATPGKKVLGIIVTDEGGNRLTFERALVRNLCKILSQLIFYIGYIMAAFTEKSQALHDIIAKTLVLKKV